MLENFNFNIFDESYSSMKRSDLGERLAILQRQCNHLKIPVLILIDGWESSGKGYIIKDLIRELDPKYYRVFLFESMTDKEESRPFSQEFWVNLPPRGNFAIYDRSLYHRTLKDRHDREDLDKRIAEINNVEKTLFDDGYIIVKFFLHITEDIQRENIEKNKNNIDNSFLVDDKDIDQNKNYNKYLKHFDYLLDSTNLIDTPWKVVSANDRKEASKYILGKAIEEIEKGIDRNLNLREVEVPLSRKNDKGPKYLEKVDLKISLDKDIYEDSIEKLQKRAAELAYTFYKEKIPSILVFEGMDAAGKGGGIKRLTREIDPRGYLVATTSAPSSEEKEYNYLWRFYKNMPKKGFMVIFDRSWYGRVLVERVEGFATVNEWDRAFAEINKMEKDLFNYGAFIIKYFLYIDKDEQLKRFKEREEEKVYKITEEDWRNREKWEDYILASNEMIDRTSTEFAPWTVVESNDKRYSRIKILKTFIDKAEKFLKKGDIK